MRRGRGASERGAGVLDRSALRSDGDLDDHAAERYDASRADSGHGQGTAGEHYRRVGNHQRTGLTAQDFIDNALDVQPVPRTSLIRLNVALSDPTKARLAAALLANKVMQLSQRVDRDAGSASLATLERRLADAERPLKDAEERLLTFQAGVDRESLSAENISKIGPRTPTKNQAAEIYRRRLQLARLQTEYDARTRAYYALALGYEEAIAAAALPSGPQLQILVGPVQPDRPMPRRHRQFATLGGLLGLVCGIVSAVAIEGRRAARPVNA
jgi:uncharacterized protein involved in exopolysaccharide biosynthesis